MQHVVVTGANGGLGLEFCRHYLKQGDRVTAICRTKTPELEKLDLSIIEQVDLTQEQSYNRIRETIGSKPIDLLINNAGLLIGDSLENFELQAIRNQFEINALAPLRLSQCLLPNLHKGSKIAMITSRMGSIADNSSGGSYGYRASKAALNIIGVSLAHDLKEQGIWVGLLHPGYVRTKMTSMSGQLSPEESVAGLVKLIANAKLEESGGFWHSNGERLPW